MQHIARCINGQFRLHSTTATAIATALWTHAFYHKKYRKRRRKKKRTQINWMKPIFIRIIANECRDFCVWAFCFFFSLFLSFLCSLVLAVRCGDCVPPAENASTPSSEVRCGRVHIRHACNWRTRTAMHVLTITNTTNNYNNNKQWDRPKQLAKTIGEMAMQHVRPIVTHNHCMSVYDVCVLCMRLSDVRIIFYSFCRH